MADLNLYGMNANANGGATTTEQGIQLNFQTAFSSTLFESDQCIIATRTGTVTAQLITTSTNAYDLTVRARRDTPPIGATGTVVATDTASTPTAVVFDLTFSVTKLDVFIFTVQANVTTVAMFWDINWRYS